MLCTKQLRPKRVKTVRAVIANFSGGINTKKSESCLPISTATMAYNFDFSSGDLKQAFGIVSLTVLNKNATSDSDKFVRVVLPNDFLPIACYHYKHYDANNGYVKAHKLVFIDEARKLMQMSIPNDTNGYFNSSTSYMVVDALPKSVLNYRLNNRDVLILTFENDSMQVYDASNPESSIITKITNAPKIISMCVHYERLFAVVAGQRNAVWFSKELDPTMWDVSLTGAGFIEMIDERGELTKVVSFGGYVYIFREYGIARLTAYGDQTEFSVTQLFTSSGRIYENSVTICGDKIMFLAEDGLYYFDGSATNRIEMGVENLFDKNRNKYAVSAFHNGKFYLACFLKYPDPGRSESENNNYYKNNTVIEMDLKTGNLQLIRGFDISYFTCINETEYSQLACCHNSARCSFVGEFIENDGSNYLNSNFKFWQSPKTDLGHAGKTKIVKEIFLSTKTDVTLTVETDIEKKEFKIKGSEKLIQIRTNIKGEFFTLKFLILGTKAKISKPEFVFEIL